MLLAMSCLGHDMARSNSRGRSSEGGLGSPDWQGSLASSEDTATVAGAEKSASAPHVVHVNAVGWTAEAGELLKRDGFAVRSLGKESRIGLSPACLRALWPACSREPRSPLQ